MKLYEFVLAALMGLCALGVLAYNAWWIKDSEVEVPQTGQPKQSEPSRTPPHADQQSANPDRKE